MAVDKGLAGEGLLAHIITSKYCDHAPLNRLEDIFKRSDVEINVSTMCDWVGHCSYLLEPLVKRMHQKILESPKINSDDTSIPVKNPGRKGSTYSNVIKIDEAQVKNHLGNLVRKTVEETLNDMLNTEAQQLCNAKRYERNEARKDCRAGYYKRKLHTNAVEVELKMPKLRYATFEIAIVERYRRRESDGNVSCRCIGSQG